MDNNQLCQMLELMISATRKRKLSWEPTEVGSTTDFSAPLGTCSARVYYYYDSGIEDSGFGVILRNAKGQNFFQEFYSSQVDTDTLKLVATLYDEICDSYYQITESKAEILSTLKSLNE